MTTNTIKMATAGLALTAVTGSASALSPNGPLKPQRYSDTTLSGQKGVGRVPLLSKTPVVGSGTRRVSHIAASMRDSIINTHRNYPVGRDSREAMVAFGLDVFADAAMRNAGESLSSGSVNSGTVGEHTHSFENLLPQRNPLPEHNPLAENNPLVEHNPLTEHAMLGAAHHLEHDAAQLARNALHNHPHMDLHHSLDHASVDILKNIAVRTSGTPEGKSNTPALLVSGGLALAALAGVAHGVEVADHVLMAKLQSWPAAYQYAAKMNEGIGAIASHMEASGAGQALRNGLAEMIQHSNIETVVDFSDPSSFQSLKLNLKPVPSGPTLSLTLTAADKVESEPGVVVKPKRKEFSVDLPGGGLTLTLPEQEPDTGRFGLGGPKSIPASISFVEKYSGAEFALGKVDVPLVK